MRESLLWKLRHNVSLKWIFRDTPEIWCFGIEINKYHIIISFGPYDFGISFHN